MQFRPIAARDPIENRKVLQELVRFDGKRLDVECNG